ncbi:universal stress protein [Hymenobacter sp. 15J16-1T3B]|uniref:universal stress protein n=1 Tax=Hymenobacter sp. 15J16-1T3B TaxID=2886941 RepID=UPI001D1015A8|nr:universal stress protein [Hymenobacter sp. 15J16-1T3B]MCC3159156.1 universal stress protein [Hymenobacter sp. 15J16-1T3B]
MKTILVPLDLTAAAEPTVVYANKLAVRLGAEVVLLYCHHGALSPADAADYQQRLHTLAERLRYVQLVRQDGRRIRYRFAVRTGCLHDHVQDVIDECGAELLVMGLEHVDCGEAAIGGNHAARIAGLARCPVLVVPPGARTLPQRAAFLADFGHLDAAALAPLIPLLEQLKPQLQLVHFYQQLDLPELLRVKRGMQLMQRELPGIPLRTRLVLDDDPLEGIGEFCEATQAQLLVFAPTGAALLDRFFDVCYTKTQAYHTRIPLLVLPQPTRSAEGVCCEHCAQLRPAGEVKKALSVALGA